MFVCLCNGYTDRDILDAARECTTLDEIYERLGGEPQCGGCLDYAESLIGKAEADEADASGFVEALPAPA